MRSDFEKILSKTGAYVIRIPALKSIDSFVGAETLSDGVSETILVSVAKENTKWKVGKMGEMENADLVMFTKYTQEVNKNDKITLDTRIYRIQNVLNVYEEGYIVFKKCALYLIE
jgi:hypothetical protein